MADCRSPRNPTMARPSRKRGNPDFVSSSFYIPRCLNLQFDRAILDLKAAGHLQIDRSDVLRRLIESWVANPVAPSLEEA
jgi:hypothetical protein